MTPSQAPSARAARDVRGLRIGLWVAGLAAICLGLAAIVFPFAASLAADLLFGGLLVALGLLQIVGVLLLTKDDSRVSTLLLGGLALGAGVIMLLFPMGGMVTLTLVVATFFLLGGLAQLLGAIRARRGRRRALGLPALGGRGWRAASGAVSLLLGGFLLVGLPVTATWALGALLGVDLIVLGASEIAVATALTTAAAATAPPADASA